MRQRLSQLCQRALGGQVIFSALSGFIVQFVRPLAALVTVPFLIGELGQSGLGVWMIALSLMGLVGTLNTGLSINLVTAVGRASEQNSALETVRLATGATIIAMATALLVLAFCLPAIWLIDWSSLLKLHGEISAGNVRAMLAALAAVLAFGFIAAVPRQIMMGRLHGYVAHMLDLAGVIVGSVALIAALYMDQPLWVLASAFMGPGPILLLLGGIVYLQRQGIAMFSCRAIDRKTINEFGRDSMRMVWYHTSYSVSSQSDLLLIGALLGAPASAVYGVAQRIFSLPISFALSVSQAQWPAMARDDARGDQSSIAKTLRLTLLIMVPACAVLSSGIAMLYPSLVSLWLGSPLQTDAALLIGMVVWVPLAAAVSIYDAALRAQNASSYLARSMFVMATINLASSIIFIRMFGYSGALWGTVLSYALALLIPYALRFHAQDSRNILHEGAR